MKKIKGLILSLVFLPLGYAAASQSTQQQMGPVCQRGITAFYGQMTRTYSEEKLCRISETRWEFWTKDGLHTAVGAKPVRVIPYYNEGTIGHTEGYDIYLTEKDVVGLRVVFSKDDDILPLAGFIVINEDYIDLDPMTILIDERIE